jgi:hypothetical protein
MPDLSNLDYFTVVIAIIVLAVIWGILQRVVQFTARIFACGCAVILGLALGIFVLVNWGEIARSLGI